MGFHSMPKPVISHVHAHRKYMDRIIQQDKIVTDVFPTAIRDRLYANNGRTDKPQDDMILDDFEGQSNVVGEKPLADLFPNTTVVFADIAGFTAWSSAREPRQVFTLLETIYGAFDKIAYRHNVFKVETVGDCFVAVAGLPEPNEEHACKCYGIFVDLISSSSVFKPIEWIQFVLTNCCFPKQCARQSLPETA